MSLVHSPDCYTPKGVYVILITLNFNIQYKNNISKNGFEWEKSEQIWDKLYEELEELKDALKKENTAEAEAEIGDVLFTLINIARWNNISIEEGLAKTNKRFLERLTYIEKNIDGELHSQSKKKLEKYWELAKINLKH